METVTSTAPKSVIITGGNAGLGYQCAQSIASQDREWNIVLACRDIEKANLAADQLKSETKNSNIDVMELDLASLQSVRRFASLFATSHHPPLHGIVCNAGLQIISGTSFTDDGFEMTFGVNHLGHFLLVNVLLKQMAEPGRIVFVSSGTHDPEQTTGIPAPIYVNARLLSYPEEGSSGESEALIGRRRYSTSKLCNIYCTYELADRIKRETGKHITVNAFDPGLMPGTGLARQVNPVAFFVWKYIMPVMTILPINANTPKKSGRALARLILDPELSEVTGKYFEGLKEIQSSKLSYDKKNSRDLWMESVSLTKLRKQETILSL